jgi:hypothetical protein
MRGRTPALAFLGVLALVLAALPSPGSGAETNRPVFEVPFKPLGPGQYAVVASIRGVSAASIAPIRLGVVGFADGIIEEPGEADSDVMRHGGRSKGRLTR